MSAPARREPVTAADVSAAAERGVTELVLPALAVVTPLARDVARELGVTLAPAAAAGVPADTQRAAAPAAGGHEDALIARVQRIVTDLLGGPAPPPALSPEIRHVDSRQVSSEPFPFEGPGSAMDVRVADVVTHEHGASMGVGFLSLTRGSFPWTLTYDEVEYVLEGELHLGTEAGVIVGRPGDVLYVPRGSHITFGTPSWARLLYVTYPADWTGSP